MSPDRPRTLIVGAGVSGLCVATFLARRGHDVEVWESEAQPGGLLQPVRFRDVACDRGSHRVHADALPLLRQAAPELTWAERPRRGRLVFSGGDGGHCRQVPYPLRLGGFLHGLGPTQALRFALGFLRRDASLRKYIDWERDRTRAMAATDDTGDAGGDAATADDPGFAHFVQERVGRAAYDAFYRPYVEKVWGLPADQISKSVAKKRVSTARPLQVLRGALLPRLPLWRATTQPRESGTFLYPPQGTGALVDALRAQAAALGIPIHLGRAYRGDSDHTRVVYTGHISDLLQNEGPAATLSHRGLYLLYLALPTPTLGAVDTFYVPGDDLWFGRVSLPLNFSPQLAVRGETILCVEIPEGRWGPGQDFTQPDLLRQVLAQLVRAGILPGARRQSPIGRPLAAQQLFLPRIYPLYRRGWVGRWQHAMRQIAAHGKIYPAGRQGLFLHCNIDHCVQIAHDLAERLLAGRSAADWVAHSEQYLDVRVRD